MVNLPGLLFKLTEIVYLYLSCFRDGVITTAEFFNYMKGREGCPKATKIEKISKILDEDHDGKIRVADLTKVFHHCLASYRVLHLTLKYGVVWLWLRWLGVVWYAMLCYAMLCYAMLCYAMLCYAMLCYAMLCYAMLCYAIPWCIYCIISYMLYEK